jgi:hypothetical protein
MDDPSSSQESEGGFKNVSSPVPKTPLQPKTKEGGNNTVPKGYSGPKTVAGIKDNYKRRFGDRHPAGIHLTPESVEDQAIIIRMMGVLLRSDNNYLDHDLPAMNSQVIHTDYEEIAEIFRCLLREKVDDGCVMEQDTGHATAKDTPLSPRVLKVPLQHHPAIDAPFNPTGDPDIMKRAVEAQYDAEPGSFPHWTPGLQERADQDEDGWSPGTARYYEVESDTEALEVEETKAVESDTEALEVEETKAVESSPEAGAKSDAEVGSVVKPTKRKRGEGGAASKKSKSKKGDKDAGVVNFEELYEAARATGFRPDGQGHHTNPAPSATVSESILKANADNLARGGVIAAADAAISALALASGTSPPEAATDRLTEMRDANDQLIADQAKALKDTGQHVDALRESNDRKDAAIALMHTNNLTVLAGMQARLAAQSARDVRADQISDHINSSVQIANNKSRTQHVDTEDTKGLLAAANSDLERMKAETAAANRDLARMKAETAAAKRDLERMKADTDKAKKQMQQEVDEVKSRLFTANGALTAANGEWSATVTILEEKLQGHIHSSSKEVEELQRQLATANGEWSATVTILEEKLKGHIHSSSKEVEELQRQLATANGDMEQLKQETDNLKAQLKQETDNLKEQLKQETDNLKAQLKQETDNLKEQLKKQEGTKKATSAPCNGPPRMSKDLEAKLFSGSVEIQHDVIAFVNEMGLQPRLCNKCDAEDAEAATGRS